MSATSSKVSRERAQSFICVVIILFVGSIIYSNSLEGPFVLDDKSGIVGNPSIRHLWPPEWLEAHRPVATFTLAVNFALHGLEVQGYHIVNMLIHLAAGVVLFGVMRQTLVLGDLRDRYAKDRDWLALGTALIWMAHPLQTQSVTYVIQRMESLMGLFYLLTLWGFVRAQNSQKPTVFYVASVMACALGMATKEIMATAPLIVLTFDRIFVADSWRQIRQSRKFYYAALFATWFILAAVGPWSGLASSILQEEAHRNSPALTGPAAVAPTVVLTPLNYALSQPGVICHYLKLTVLPVGQCLDLYWPIADSATEIIVPGLFLVALLIVTFYTLYRSPRWGFLGWWFFLILAPTSSIVPIKDLAFEHRMYLSLAAPAVLFVVGGYELIRRRGKLSPRIWLFGVVPIAVLVLGMLTYSRNEDYRSAQAVWEDVVKKAPHNPRALNNYGLFLDKAGRSSEALQYYNKVLRIAPDYDQRSDVHMNIGNIYHRRRDYAKSRECYLEALQVSPNNTRALSNMGISMIVSGDTETALALFERALKIAPRSAEYHTNVGLALSSLGRNDEAMQHFETALELDPRFERARQMIRRIQQPGARSRNPAP